MTNKDKQIKEMLISEGAENVDSYVLINNDGFTFEYKGKKYDLRHWRNVYGAECDFYDCSCLSGFENTNSVERAFMKRVKDLANEINEGEN